MHWAIDYLGKPWVSGGRGPDCFDCWGLVCDIYQKQFEIELSPFEGYNPKDLRRTNEEIEKQGVLGEWIKLDEPEDNCLVLMSKNKAFHHIGIFIDIDGGKVIHACDGANVLIQHFHKVELSGFVKFAFYRHGSYHSRN